MILRTVTPCCGQRIRLSATTAVQRERFDRTCRCGRVWVVTRETLTERADARVDQLTWDPVTPRRG